MSSSASGSPGPAASVLWPDDVEVLFGALDASTEGMLALVEVRRAGRIVDFAIESANVAASVLFGREPARLVGHRLLQVVPSERNGLLPVLAEVSRGGRTEIIEHRFVNDGLQGRHRVVMVKRPGGVAVSITVLDGERPLRRLERIAHLLTPAGSHLLRVGLDDGDLVAASESARSELGAVSSSGGVVRTMAALLASESAAIWRASVVPAVSSIGLWRGELIFEPVRGLRIATRATVVADAGGGPAVATVLVRDRELLERVGERLAPHDLLTGLPGSLLLMARIEAGLSRHRRTGSDLAVLTVRLEGLIGLEARVASGVVHRLGLAVRTGVRQGDMAARDEEGRLVIVVEGVLSGEDLVSLANRLVEMLAAAAGVELGLAVGIARAASTSERGDALLERARRAGDRAAEGGGNRVAFAQAAPWVAASARRRG